MLTHIHQAPLYIPPFSLEWCLHWSQQLRIFSSACRCRDAAIWIEGWSSKPARMAMAPHDHYLACMTTWACPWWHVWLILWNHNTLEYVSKTCCLTLRLRCTVKSSTPNVHSRGTDKLGTPSPSVPRQRRELGSNFGCLPSKLLNCVEPHHFAYKFNTAECGGFSSSWMLAQSRSSSYTKSMTANILTNLIHQGNWSHPQASPAPHLQLGVQQHRSSWLSCQRQRQGWKTLQSHGLHNLSSMGGSVGGVNHHEHQPWYQPWQPSFTSWRDHDDKKWPAFCVGKCWCHESDRRIIWYKMEWRAKEGHRLDNIWYGYGLMEMQRG